jgi:hypothetical protein
MGLKHTIAKLEDVPENVRSLYVQQGDKFVLDVDGVVPKERLEEFRTNNIELQKQIDKYKGVDPVKYAELMAIQNKIAERELLEKGEVDKIVDLRVTAMREEKDGQITALTTDLTSARAQLHSLLIDNVIKSGAIQLGVIPAAVDDVVLRAKGVFTVENGVPTPKSPDGAVIYGKDGKAPMSVTEWLGTLKGSAAHLFHGSKGSGAGGGDRGAGGSTANLTPAQKISQGLSQMNTGATAP